jgi:hypothetical protein
MNEEVEVITFGNGYYGSELPDALTEGYCAEAINCVANGTSLEMRQGFALAPYTYEYSRYGPCGAHTLVRVSDNTDTNPAFVWSNGEEAKIWAVKGIDRTSGVIPSGTFFRSFTISAIPRAFTSYNDRVYSITKSVTTTGVRSHHTWDWATGAVTTITLADSPHGIGITTFKDRMWAWRDNRLFFTEIALPGGYPDTWNVSTNFIDIVSDYGKAQIQAVVPLYSNLYIFTTNGLYSLNVVGEPENWTLSTLNGTVRCNSCNCAFEYNGVVFYVSSDGVWATNGANFVKLSQPIDHEFNQASDAFDYVYSITKLQEGALVNIKKVKNRTSDGTGLQVSAPTKVYYSKLSQIGWSEWQLTHPNINFAEVVSALDDVPTAGVKGPYSYILASTQLVSTPNAKDKYQLFIYDGRTDAMTPSSAVGIAVKSRYIDSQSFTIGKRALVAYLDVYTSNTQLFGSYQWFTQEGQSVEVIASGTIPPQVSTLMKLEADFYYRKAQIQIILTALTNTDQIKLKSVAVLHRSHRHEPENIR